MSTTIISSPKAFQPCKSDGIFFSVSADTANQPKFRFVYVVYINNYPIFQGKAAPNPNGIGIIDVSRVLDAYLQNYPIAYHDQTPIFVHQTTPFSTPYRNEVVDYYIEVGEEYSDSYIGSITGFTGYQDQVGLPQIQSSTFKAFLSTMGVNRNANEQNFDIGKFVLSGTPAPSFPETETGLFLTNSPRIREIGENEYYTLSFTNYMLDEGATYLSEPYYVQYTFYDDTGSPITAHTYANIVENGGGPMTGCSQTYENGGYTGTTKYNILNVGAGPKNIYNFPNNTAYYDVQLFGNARTHIYYESQIYFDCETPYSLYLYLKVPETDPQPNIGDFFQVSGYTTYCYKITQVVDPDTIPGWVSILEDVDEFYSTCEACYAPLQPTPTPTASPGALTPTPTPTNTQTPTQTGTSTPTPTPSETRCGCYAWSIENTSSSVIKTINYVDCDGLSTSFYANPSTTYEICACSVEPQMEVIIGQLSTCVISPSATPTQTPTQTPSSLPNSCVSGTTINITDTGWIKYEDCYGVTQYKEVTSLGAYTITDCHNCNTIAPGLPFADFASFDTVVCGSACTPTVTPTPTSSPQPPSRNVKIRDCCTNQLEFYVSVSSALGISNTIMIGDVCFQIVSIEGDGADGDYTTAPNFLNCTECRAYYPCVSTPEKPVVVKPDVEPQLIVPSGGTDTCLTGMTPVSEIFQFRVVDRCDFFINEPIMFKNRYGTWDYYRFNKFRSEGIAIDRESYSQYNTTWSSSNPIKTSYSRGSTDFNVKMNETHIVNSGWINDATAVWLEELFTTNDAYLIQEDNTLFPINIISTNFVRRTKGNRSIVNIELTYKYSNNIKLLNN